MKISKKFEHHFCIAVILLSLFVSAGIKFADFSLAGSQKEKSGADRKKTAKKNEDKLIKAGLTDDAVRSPRQLTNEILVKTKKKTASPGAKKLQALSLRPQNSPAEKNSGEKWKTYASTDGKEMEKKISELKKDPSVDFAQPNFSYVPAKIPTNDSFREMLWNLDNDGKKISGENSKPDADIDAPESWEISKNKKEITVALIDSGTAFNHPDLAGNMWNGEKCLDENGKNLGGCQHGYDFENNDPVPLPDSNAHGTMIAGALGAVKGNGKGVIGAGPDVKIMALKTDFTTSQLVRAIDFARQNGANIINASWGAGLESCSVWWDRALYESIDDFPGLFVAAAGNNGRKHDGKDFFFFPADYSHETGCWKGLDNVVSVAATDSKDELAGFSDYGENFVDIAAPGENITTLYETFGWPKSDQDGRGEMYALASGTSLSAPHAAGVAALVLSLDKNLKAKDVKEILSRSGDGLKSLVGKVAGGKRLNARNALADASGKNGGEELLSGIRIANADSVELSSSLAANIKIENAADATHFSLSRKAKVKPKKRKWLPMQDNISVKLKKNRKVQRFYLVFRDASGNLSPVHAKSFRYRKI